MRPAAVRRIGPGVGDHAWPVSSSRMKSASAVGSLTGSFANGVRRFSRLLPAQVVAAITGRPERVNLILTGRDMPQPVLDAADTVTEMVKIKHAFDAGYVAKKGIDY